MTQDDFNSCYTGYKKNTKNSQALGASVFGLAYRIVPDADFAFRIQKEVMEIGRKYCAEFEVETAWEGKGDWPGLKKLTRDRCKIMISRPERENPLAKETLNQWPDDPWTAAVANLPFRYRQIFLLGMGFSNCPRSLYALLNEHMSKNEKKLTLNEIKNLQVEASTLMVANLTEPYLPRT